MLLATPMSNPLAIYLHDHLAGAAFAIDLLESLSDYYSGEALGQLAAGWLIEVQQDQEVLQRITDRAGKESSHLKEAAAWLAEKVSRLKLSHDAKGFGTFQALETLALGIFGKLELWRALKVIAEKDDRFRGIEFEELIARAQRQYDQVEENRLLVARSAF